MNEEIYEQKKAAFEDKKARKLEHFENMAAKKAAEAQQVFDHAKKMADVIPFGQPILVGHHSEKRDRNYRERIHNKFDKAFELNDVAKHYEDKVEAMQNNHAISADDPDAIVKLKAKLAHVMENHAKWKAMKPNPNQKDIFAKDSAHWRGVEMTSLSAEARRIKKRIAELEAVDKMPDYNKNINGVHIYSDKIENRLKMEFAGKPAQEIINALKAAGFHWSPYNKVWQRMISNAAIYYAEKIAGDVKP